MWSFVCKEEVGGYWDEGILDYRGRNGSKLSG